jgi:tetratricopeptide (TPR) repeat protein
MSTPVESSAPLPKGANLARAIALFHQGRYDRMEAEARAELARDPDDHEALTWLGLALFKLQREEEALAVLADAIRLRPDHADAHYVRARVLWHKSVGKRLMAAMLSMFGESLSTESRALEQQCEEALAEALRLNPGFTEYHDFLADIRREQGRFDEGLAAAERGLALDPNHVNCLFNRAMLLEKLGRLDEAREAFEATLARAPEYPAVHLEFGKLLLRMDAPGRALEHLRESLRLHPNLEGDVRPLITEAMKRHSALYDWLAKNISSPWVVGCFVAVLLAASWFGRGVSFPPLEVINNDLVPGMGYVLLFLSFMTAIDPLYSLRLCRTSFGRLMLSDTERHQAYALAVCLGVALIAAVWFLAAYFGLNSGQYTSAYLFLFTLFWIDPVLQSFSLYPRSLQRIATACTALSIGLVAVYLGWRYFSTQEVRETWYAHALILVAAGFYLLLVPFILSRSASEFSFWRPRARRRAVLTFWCMLLVTWFLVVAGCFGAHFSGAYDMFSAIRQVAMVPAIAFGVALYFETALIDWLAFRFGEKPAT